MKHYPPEFTADAVALYRSRPGVTIKSVAADLGGNTETLRTLIRAADGRRPGLHLAAQTAAPAPNSAKVTAFRERPYLNRSWNMWIEQGSWPGDLPAVRV